MTESTKEKCGTCNGTGFISKLNMKCPSCRGTGYRQEYDKIIDNIVEEKSDIKILKLIKVMGYTNSPNDNEALNACRIANSILESFDMTWQKLFSEKTIVINEIISYNINTKEVKKDEYIKTMLDICLEKIKHESGVLYIQSLYKYYNKYGTLTPAQTDGLKKWYINV